MGVKRLIFTLLSKLQTSISDDFADKQLIRRKKNMVIDLERIPSKKRETTFLGDSSQSCTTKNLLSNSSSLLFCCLQRYLYVMFQPFFSGGRQLEDCYLSAMLYTKNKVHICNDIFVTITSSCSSKINLVLQKLPRNIKDTFDERKDHSD